ncbi:MAG: helix-turn-helix transcriptional regulator [Clostridia bacterium]|nr:helix-turn-helix transcriptional regulator [Clostridia bacterium]
MVFFVFLFLIFVGGVVWELFYTFSLISISITAKFVIFTLNIILIINLLLIFRGIDKIKKELKPLVLSCSIFILFSILYSFLINIFNNLPLFFYKVPISPVVYFYVNLAGIIYVKKYIFAMNENEKQVNDIVACYDYIKLYDFNKLAISYELTERELEIVRHIVDGLSNQDIAKRLFISPNTVKNHIYNTYKKIGIKNRFELISLLSKMKSESKLNNQI